MAVSSLRACCCALVGFLAVDLRFLAVDFLVVAIEGLVLLSLTSLHPKAGRRPIPRRQAPAEEKPRSKLLYYFAFFSL